MKLEKPVMMHLKKVTKTADYYSDQLLGPQVTSADGAKAALGAAGSGGAGAWHCSEGWKGPRS